MIKSRKVTPILTFTPTQNHIYIIIEVGKIKIKIKKEKREKIKKVVEEIEYIN